ncbi:head-tail adaptor Ad2 [Synechococcus phage ACG-2014i]|uniref:Neck protein n=1 Tax=Synechococcus phage ACG-2014i TaxID=1493513 RepID=A0A0E3FH91_9CAUD|nr:head-tail adaptor Ad2 [Synechococcus phage ACG-2014i]AIX26810.1 neck protein [Synechococcus phage ACG-2014i]
MASPNSRADLITYCKRQLGEPVLQVNIDDEQVNNVIDDTYQFFQENCYNGMERCFLRHKITDEDITRFDSKATTSSGTTDWEESTNYIPIPDHVVGISKVYGLVSNSIRSNLFGVEYQMFLNDLYAFGSLDIVNYFMNKQYLETLDMILNNGAFQQFRYTQRRDRLYLDIKKSFLNKDRYLVIEAHRMIDPTDATEMNNDMFVKKYAAALMKRQWGQNLIKYNNVQLPGGITLNGRELYTDALAEIEKIESEVLSKYALPPMDMIG